MLLCLVCRPALFVHDFLFGPPATQNTFSPYLHMNETFLHICAAKMSLSCIIQRRLRRRRVVKSLSCIYNDYAGL